MCFHDISKHFYIMNCRKVFFLCIKDLFINAESMWCTQHMENNDTEKLRSVGVNDKDLSRIMADTYGSQNEILSQNGLG